MVSNTTATATAGGVVAGIGCLWITLVISFWVLVFAALLKFVGVI